MPAMKNCGCASPPPPSRSAAPICPATGPARQYGARRHERRGHREVGDEPASEVGGPHPGEQPARSRRRPRSRAPAPQGARRPPGRSWGPSRTAAPRPRGRARARGWNQAWVRSNTHRARSLAHQREPVGGGHPRPPQVHGHVGPDREHRAVAQARPEEEHGQPDREEHEQGEIHADPSSTPVRAGLIHPATLHARPGVREGAASIAAMLDRDLVAEVLTLARRKGGDFAEVFVEERSSTSIRLDDAKVEELTTGLDRGAGVRVVDGTSYGYAFSNRLDADSLREVAEAASAALRDGASGAVVDLVRHEGVGPQPRRASGRRGRRRGQGGVAPGGRRRGARLHPGGHPGHGHLRRLAPAPC